MTIGELHSHIYCWLWLYSNLNTNENNSTEAITLRDEYYNRWLKEMLIDIATLKIPNIVLGTSMGKNLQCAIHLAESGDCSTINEIASILIKVNSAIAIHLSDDLISIN